MRFGSVNLLSGEIEACHRAALMVAFDLELVAIAVEQFQPRPRVGQPRPIVRDLRLITGSGVGYAKGVKFARLLSDFNGDVSALDRWRDAVFDGVFNQRLQRQAGQKNLVAVFRLLDVETEPPAEAELFQFEVQANDLDLGVEWRSLQTGIGQNLAIK